MGECFLKDDFNDPSLMFHIIRPKEPEKWNKDVALSKKDMEDPNNFGSPEFSAFCCNLIAEHTKMAQEVYAEC